MARMNTTMKKSWTFMVYMAGDNNLDPNGVQDLKEMKKVGSTKDVNVIVQFDRATGHVAKRYYLSKGGKVNKDEVANVGKVNTGDPKRLFSFIKWGVKQYPAERYALVLWNHGQGWDDTDIFANDRHRRLRRLASGRIRHTLFHSTVRSALKRAIGDVATRAILIDDDAKDFLDNQEMKKVLKQTRSYLKRNLDLLGMDACLMSMIEVGYQMHESVSFTVGSEETEPLDGWPYHTILSDLAKNPAMTPLDLSKLIVSKYIASYLHDPVTQSACDLSKSETLAGTITNLANALTAGLAEGTTRQHILSARTKAQSYEVRDNIDLTDFCTLLVQTMPGTTIAGCSKDVVQAAKSAYVISSDFKGAEMSHSHGVSIYFPQEQVSPLYEHLDFNVKTGWANFLKAYIAGIRAR